MVHELADLETRQLCLLHLILLSACDSGFELGFELVKVLCLSPDCQPHPTFKLFVPPFPTYSHSKHDWQDTIATYSSARTAHNNQDLAVW